MMNIMVNAGSMPIKVVTIDFWNTLFDSSGGALRNAARMKALRDAIDQSGLLCEPEILERSYKAIWEYFDDHWLNHQRTPTSREMVREICRCAQIDLHDKVVEQVAEVFARGVLDHPPELLPGAREGVEFLADRAKLALISDTAFSPGSVLRELMESVGIAGYFDIYVFSDETGVAKPHPEAFRRAYEPLGCLPSEALHIGDIERTDILGAKSAGMKAMLYKGDTIPHKYAEEHTAADMVIWHWGEIGESLRLI